MTRDELYHALNDAISRPGWDTIKLMEHIDAYVTAKMLADQKRRRYIIEPDTVEHPKTVGDIRRAIEPLTDDAQMFIAISGHGEDYAIAEVDMSQQVDDAGYLVFGLEIHLGLFPERSKTRAES